MFTGFCAGPPRRATGANLGRLLRVLRDEAEMFSDRLMGAGIPVAFRVVQGVNHGFMGAPTPPPQVSESLAVISAWFCAAD